MAEVAGSVLMVEAGALGDTVLQLRLVEAVRNVWDGCRITWLGRDSWLPIVRRCPVVDAAVGLDAMRAYRLFDETEATDPDLVEWFSRFDWIVNGMAPTESPMGRRLQRFARRGALEHTGQPEPDAQEHVVVQWLRQVGRQLAGRDADVAPRIRRWAPLSPDPAGVLLEAAASDIAEAEGRLRRGGLERSAWRGRLVLLHPGSGGLGKCWPIERYGELCGMLAARGLVPTWLFGPAEQERWPDRVAEISREYAAIEEASLADLVALAGLAGVYVGNDSGPTHVAAAAGAATVAVFGPTDPQVWQPLGPRVKVLRSREYQRNWADLPAEAVAEEVAALCRVE